MIPLLDLGALNAELQEEIEEAVLRVARSGRYILGSEVEAFEAEWAAYCGVAHCVGTGNALEALQLIMMAYRIGEGDEVIVPSNTYIATWLGVSLAGARPVPVEPDPVTFNIDPGRVEDAITSKTRAILAVHLYGLPADMSPLTEIARRRSLYIFADAAQAHGASYRGRRAGSLCDAEAFSFYPSKNLGALGDAGCVTTDDDSIAIRVRRLRNYGGVGRIDHTVRGINSRLDEMQAAILRAKLPRLAYTNLRRGHRASAYIRGLAGLPLTTPQWTEGAAWHQFVIRVHGDRDRLQRVLFQRGVDTHVHYPVPPHLEGAYADMGRLPLPIAEQLGREVLSLPIGNNIDASAVAETIRATICELTL